MDEVEGARSFLASGAAYDAFMGRYSRRLAMSFADAAGIAAGQSVLDVGCGPGALTAVLRDRFGPGAVSACDPSEPFVAECRTRLPGVDVRLGRAEAIPFPDASFDAVFAQLVLHFVSDPAGAVAEFRRVARPCAVVAACVWDFDDGMKMLRRFWDAALSVDADAPDEAHTMRFGRSGEIADLFSDGGLEEITETTLRVDATYADFDELWSGFLGGIGPAGSYCLALDDAVREQVRAALFRGLGEPSGSFSLAAAARFARAVVPG